MPSIKSFDEIEAWRKARELTKLIYEITASGSFSLDFGLRDQIRRASISVVSNIAEGFERRGDKEFRRFLSIAKGSLGELKTQLLIANDIGLLNPVAFQRLYERSDEIGRMIGGLQKYINKSIQR